MAVDPFGDNSDTVATLTTVATAGHIVNGRAAALPLTDLLHTWPDYNLAMRDYTAQQRSNLVAEGKAGKPGTWQAHCPEATGHE